MTSSQVPPYAEEWATHQRSFADIRSGQRPGWLIKDVVPQGSIVFVTGIEGTAKSFLVQSWAASIATGTDWFGHETKPGVVYYLALEGNPWFIVDRFEAWGLSTGKEIDSARRLPIVSSFNHTDKHQMDNLLEGVRSGVALVVVDTLAKFAGDANLNNQHEVAFVKNFAEQILEASNYLATVVYVAHSTKTDQPGASGSGQLNAASDMTWHMSRTGSNFRMKHHKTKNGSEHPVKMFQITNVALSPDVSAGVLTSSDRSTGSHPAVERFIRVLFGDIPPYEPVKQSALIAQALNLHLKESRSTVSDWLNKAEKQGLLVSAGSRENKTFSMTDNGTTNPITDVNDITMTTDAPFLKNGQPVIDAPTRDNQFDDDLF